MYIEAISIMRIHESKGGIDMAVKNANVIARVEPDIKEQAEKILSDMGISASAAINMFYRQIIICDGLPFRPSRRPVTRSEMTDEEFNARMATGLAQAMAGESAPVDEVFAEIQKEINNASKILGEDYVARDEFDPRDSSVHHQ